LTPVAPAGSQKQIIDIFKKRGKDISLAIVIPYINRSKKITSFGVVTGSFPNKNPFLFVKKPFNDREKEFLFGEQPVKMRP